MEDDFAVVQTISAFGVRLRRLTSCFLFADAKAARQWGKALKLVDPNIKVTLLSDALLTASSPNPH